MPSATTMLAASEHAILAARGSGNAGWGVIAHLGPQVRALTELVIADAAAEVEEFERKLAA